MVVRSWLVSRHYHDAGPGFWDNMHKEVLCTGVRAEEGRGEVSVSGVLGVNY